MAGDAPMHDAAAALARAAAGARAAPAARPCAADQRPGRRRPVRAGDGAGAGLAVRGAGSRRAAAGQGACGVCAACRLHAVAFAPRSAGAAARSAARRARLGWRRRRRAEPDRRQGQAEQGDQGRCGARRGRLRAGHRRARARQGGGRPSGRAHERHRRQRAAEDAGGAARRDALHPRQRGAATPAADDPQPLPGAAAAPARAGSRRSAWLAEQGVAAAEVLLAATGGQVQQVHRMAARRGWTRRHGQRLPQALARGETGALAGWPLPQVARCAAEGLPRRDVPRCRRARRAIFRRRRSSACRGRRRRRLQRLADWSRELQRIARHVEHPFSAAAVDRCAGCPGAGRACTQRYRAPALPVVRCTLPARPCGGACRAPR